MAKRKHDEAEDVGDEAAQPLFESAPIHDRASKFIAIFSPSTTSPRQLQMHAPFESAMHRILAWRKASTQRSLAGSFGTAPGSSSTGASRVVYETGSDEDGEKYAGKKLEKVLEAMKVEGVVVVARWYGGVLLGPVRFKWIEDSAKEAILKWKASLGKEDEDVKKMKIDEFGVVQDAKQKELLIKVLEERDASIAVLRGLLAEKSAELKKIESGEGDGNTGQANVVKSPSKPALDYKNLPLERLKQMEKARDASLTWILKQIDDVEKKIEVSGKEKSGD